MLDVNLARLAAHQNNVHRYRKLLRTPLTELERDFIERRMREEEAKFAALSKEVVPFALPQGAHAEPSHA
jgi:hypothetical protein